MHQLHISCHRTEVDEISEWLDETGPVSITLTDKQDDPILEPELGTTPLWPHVVIQALYSDELEAQSALAQLSERFSSLDVVIEPVPEKDWERAWMDQFTPMQFGSRLWVCPSWLTPPEPEAANLILDPGLAFGTGTHPTTSLCLTWLDSAELENKTLIDYGCGSGILALAALKLGAKHVYAVDIDEQALIATRNNAETNQINETQLSISQPDALAVTTDLIIANILLKPLLSLREQLHALLKPNGKLVVSGVLTEQCAELIYAYSEGFKHCSTSELGDWALIEFKAL